MKQICEGVSGPGSRFKGKHSLDSDEEDEGEESKTSKYDILASDDVEGMSKHKCISSSVVNCVYFSWLSFIKDCNFGQYTV